MTIEYHATSVGDELRDRVARLSLLLDRDPDPAVVASRARHVVTGEVSLEEHAEAVIGSDAYLARHPGRTPAEFVASLYRDALGRDGDREAISAWTTAIKNGTSLATVALSFTDSPEAVLRTGTSSPAPVPTSRLAGVDPVDSDGVLRLYLGLLGRFPTADELTDGVVRHLDGVRLDRLADEMMTSDEYLARRSDRSPGAIVDGLYADVLGRPAEPTGRAEWLARLAAGASPGLIAVGFTESIEAIIRTGTAAPASLPLLVGDDGTLVESTIVDPGEDASILAIGDSVMLAAADQMRGAIPDLAVDAKVSRQFDDGLAIVRSRSRDGGLPDTVVVHLGTNGPVDPAKCDEMMDLLDGKRVIVMTVRVPRPWEASTNMNLIACADRHQAEIADWYASARPSDFAADGYHLGGGGTGPFTDLIAASLERDPRRPESPNRGRA